MQAAPRVAFLSDSFHEVNGVALTSRQLEAYARRQGYPFFSAHAGPEDAQWEWGSVQRYELRRGPWRFSVDRDLTFDLLLWRRWQEVRAALVEFRPDVIHITGPGDLGILGLIVAKSLRLPLLASWHTNLHDYAGRRLETLLQALPAGARKGAGRAAERFSLWAVLRFYREAQMSMAPNQELIDLVEHGTGLPCRLMTRGVDTELFQPEKRTRTDDTFTFGYVGRLTSEKNVRLLQAVEQQLVQAGHERFRMLIVGQGAEAEWLQANLQRAELTGVLQGEELAQAYANMDVFLFPSATDTFGNVVQEAMASGLPAVVTNGGGPKFLVRDNETGFVTANEGEFVQAAQLLYEDGYLLARMRNAARQQALAANWEAVFRQVYDTYRETVERAAAAQPAKATAGVR